MDEFWLVGGQSQALNGQGRDHAGNADEGTHSINVDDPLCCVELFADPDDRTLLILKGNTCFGRAVREESFRYPHGIHVNGNRLVHLTVPKDEFRGSFIGADDEHWGDGVGSEARDCIGKGQGGFFDPLNNFWFNTQHSADYGNEAVAVPCVPRGRGCDEACRCRTESGDHVLVFGDRIDHTVNGRRIESTGLINTLF